MPRPVDGQVPDMKGTGHAYHCLTVGGQQLFSSYTFRCPCQVGRNFYYGSAFLIVPALVLLAAGYALRGQMWTFSSKYCCSCGPPQRRISPLERRLACLRFFGITGRALVAPLTWLAVTLLKGTYYECAASEFASVDHYSVFDKVTSSKREELLAGFPCDRPSASSDMILVRDEVALLHRYQSQMLGWILITLATTAILVSCCLARCCSPLPILQHHYWTHHLENERELFEQAAEEHSRLLIQQRLKQLFGFVPGSEDVTQIRIPSCQDWREISAPSVLCMEDATQSLYSSLGERVVGDSEEEKSGGIELKP
ncbi:calcium homeostasis modulator protein 4 isoform X2 [Fukomys damarensis]|uniref:calcium homeostasis modulator protein 4 isoform X2 n=1 Tax=Fukomys damarensis TaxID=885580 RepID=UPI00053FF3DB|nr:calcium homeostasis modulator protein 4 isoform X2 [Fukomys damarensis]XP_033619292.1 calcium homeostasis modulator protein 4 isoform X2 [Fukomys damarensis]XP_033619293.1 calcium homeostasis modulator protein 4 isoform X2 [Fukomys damarensis]